MISIRGLLQLLLISFIVTCTVAKSIPEDKSYAEPRFGDLFKDLEKFATDLGPKLAKIPGGSRGTHFVQQTITTHTSDDSDVTRVKRGGFSDHIDKFSDKIEDTFDNTEKKIKEAFSEGVKIGYEGVKSISKGIK